MNLLTARDAGCFFFNIYGKFILCEIIDKAGIIMYNKIIIIISIINSLFSVFFSIIK